MGHWPTNQVRLSGVVVSRPRWFKPGAVSQVVQTAPVGATRFQGGTSAIVNATGATAKQLAALRVGDRVELTGRLRSRYDEYRHYLGTVVDVTFVRRVEG